jgi:acetyl-CoA carboxylase biotin carboxyl carrier protein
VTAEPPAELVEALRETAASLMAQHDGPPHAVRVRATEISVELDFTGTAPAATTSISGSTASPASSTALSTASSTVDRPPRAEGASTPRRYLCSPSVGTFYRCPEPNAPPFVDVGATVTEGQQIGLIEVMKLMIPVEAEASGRITEVLKTDAEAVEYGDRLFAVVEAD